VHHHRLTRNGETESDATACPVRSGAPVVFHSVKDNGHAWPGGRVGRRGAAEPARGFNASEEIWTFFKQHRRAR
jgi:polyhydroxybutyrate depolymerase